MKRFTLLSIYLAILFSLFAVKNSIAQCALGDSLLCYYPFAGNANDQSGNDLHGMAVNATLGPDRFGNPNSAYFFDGKTAYIAANNLDYNSYEASISVWIKPVNITTYRYYNITRQGPSPANMLLSFQEYGSVLSFGVNTTGGYRELDVQINAPDYVDGNWHCVTAVYNSDSMKLFSDGVFIGGRHKIGKLVAPAGRFSIGSMNRTREFFHGWIDDIRFYNRALENREVLNICNHVAPDPLNLGPDTIVCTDTIMKTLDAFYPNSTYLWQDGSTASFYSVSKPGVYWVDVTDSCETFSDTIVIKKKDCDSILPPPPPPDPIVIVPKVPAIMILPNVFSPNGDDKNDVFRALQAEHLQAVSTEIYNRWGIKVYHTNDHFINWDGNSLSGEPISDGVYFWLVRFTDDFGEEHSLSGSLTLLR